MTGLLTAAADLLRNPATNFIAVEDQTPETPTNAVCARDVLVMAAGCRVAAGTFAYWEWRELDAAINAAWDRMAPHVGEPGGWWADRRGRTKGELIAAFEQAASEEDVKGPSTTTFRAWSKPTLLRTCRIPFVPLAVVFHAWILDGGTLAELWDRYDLREVTGTWDLLDRVEPRVAYLPDPGGVSEAAHAVRAWMHAQTPLPQTAPVQFFTTALEHAPHHTMADLLGWVTSNRPGSDSGSSQVADN